MVVKKFLILVSVVLLSACGANERYYQQAVRSQPNVAFITEKTPTLPPYGYVQFCRDNPQECPEQYDNFAKSNYTSRETTAATNDFIQPLHPLNLTYNLRRLIDKQPGEQQKFDNVISLLDAVNLEVNNSVSQVTDLEGFGVIENWRIPAIGSFINDIGDCEDFALAKRKILMDRYGFSPDALSMSVLRRRDGDIHAVLMVRTSYGDFVLDNLNDDIRAWNQTGYQWIKKQAFGNPSKWISL